MLPGATGILPWLTPLAAAMLALLMVFAIAFHARRPGEAQNIMLNVVLGVLSLAVAWGRFVSGALLAEPRRQQQHRRAER